MEKIIDLLEKYNQPKTNTLLLVVLIVSHLLLWNCVMDVKNEQIKRTLVIDVMKERL